MNLLVTTLGFSWQIVPELIGFTNPKNYNFFKDNTVVANLREAHSIKEVDEVWVITVNYSNSTIEKLCEWAALYNIKLKILVCENATNFEDAYQIDCMRSFIYQVVLTATRYTKEGALYLSLAGGRKTMSADMQQAANLFGCTAILHVVDKPGAKLDEFKADNLKETNNDYSNLFMPIVYEDNIAKSSIFKFEEANLQNFVLPIKAKEIKFSATCEFLNYINNLSRKSEQLYENFQFSLSKNDSKGNVFKGLYYIDPLVLEKLKNTKLDESYKNFIHSLPKCDLHTHLGGVLDANEIILVALAEKEKNPYLYQIDNKALMLIQKQDIKELIALKYYILSITDYCERYKRTIGFIVAFEKDPDILGRVIFDNIENYQDIGIELYQKFGDLQGSGLLQTKTTISKALELYIKKIKNDNVEYVEIRCSPNKYTKLGMTTEQVVNCILNQMDKINIEYRLIFIIGRNSTLKEIEGTVSQIVDLIKNNMRFKNHFVGVDLARTEGALSPIQVHEVFLPLLDNCIYITIHAGETELVDNIWQAVYYLSADRIGHGLKLPDKPDLMKRFLDKRIGIELCPSSNIQVVGCSDKDYPLMKFLKEGLKVTLNTDNMGISRTNLTNEFFVANKLSEDSLTLWDCIVLIRNSISVSFLNNLDKQRLMINFENKIVKLLEEL